MDAIGWLVRSGIGSSLLRNCLLYTRHGVQFGSGPDRSTTGKRSVLFSSHFRPVSQFSTVRGDNDFRENLAWLALRYLPAANIPAIVSLKNCKRFAPFSQRVGGSFFLTASGPQRMFGRDRWSTIGISDEWSRHFASSDSARDRYNIVILM